ncbi:hypothetical protein [Bifidobacterium sp. SO1]|uniref:hypothetical protein n=1 Tax=Bifidobacterium sp. SO1 TaxID=2809029 RepID=UPI001BDC21E3|nr:hypothetical protein [Bifidobacterium sp. SO1]MBT1161747.1 hypothetical protein [Bifidobacterium sp. SO1]
MEHVIGSGYWRTKDGRLIRLYDAEDGKTVMFAGNMLRFDRDHWIVDSEGEPLMRVTDDYLAWMDAGKAGTPVDAAYVCAMHARIRMIEETADRTLIGYLYDHAILDRKLALNPHVTSDMLHGLYERKGIGLAAELIRNPRTPDDVYADLESLAFDTKRVPADQRDMLRCALAASPRTNMRLLESFPERSRSKSILAALMANPRLSSDLIIRVVEARPDSALVCCRAFLHPNAPDDIIIRLKSVKGWFFVQDMLMHDAMTGRIPASHSRACHRFGIHPDEFANK